jgi:protein TonB
MSGFAPLPRAARLAEPLVFLMLAGTLHAAVWIGLPGGTGGTGAMMQPAAASGGMVGASAELSALVAEWQAAPSVSVPEAGLAADGPMLDAAPDYAETGAAPARAVATALGETSAADPLPVAPEMPPAPKPEPAAQAAPTKVAEPALARQEPAPASAAPAAAVAGGGNGLNAEKQASLIGDWAGKIRARVERRKAYPRAAVAGGLSGTVTLRLRVDADGRMIAVAVAKSSGHALLDAAALEAVRRAGAMPKAPKGITGEQAFNLPLTFRR